MAEMGTAEKLIEVAKGEVGESAQVCSLVLGDVVG